MNNNNYYVCIVTNGINYYYRNDEIQFSIEDKNGNKHQVECTHIQPNIEYDYDINIVCKSKIKYNTYKLTNTDDVFDCPVCLDTDISDAWINHDDLFLFLRIKHRIDIDDIYAEIYEKFDKLEDFYQDIGRYGID